MLKRTISFVNASNTGLAFISLMFLLPFINMHYAYPIPSFYAEWIAGVLGLAAAATLLHPASPDITKIPQISLVFLLLSVIVAVQWMMGMLHSAQYALLIISYLTWAFLLAATGSRLRHTIGWEKLITVLAWSLFIAGIINAGLLILQIVVRTGGTIPFLPYSAEYGTMSQPNHYANFTTLATISLIYLHTKGRFSSVFFALLLILFLTMLSFSGSRSAWLYLMAIVVLAFFIPAKTDKPNQVSLSPRNLLRITLFTLPAFALVQLLVYYVAPDDLVNLTTERLTYGVMAETPSARLHIWYDSLRLFLQSPWLGIGADAMKAETFLLLDAPTAMASHHIFEHAHNLFLHLLAEMGIGAFLIVLAGLVAWIRAFKWRALNLETWWLLAMLAILGIHSMLEYPLWFAYFLGIAAILLGAGDEKLVSLSLHKITKRVSTELSAKSIRIGLAILVLLGTINLGTMLIANMKLENALQQSGNTVASKQNLDWVDRYSLLSSYAELIYALSMVVDHNEIDHQFLLNQSTLRFRPLRKIAYQHVLLLMLKGDAANAKKLLSRTLIVYPYDTKYLDLYIPLQYRQAFLDLLSQANPT